MTQRMPRRQLDDTDFLLRHWVLERIKTCESFCADDLLAANLCIDKHRMYDHPNWNAEYARMLRVLESLKQQRLVEEHITGNGFSLWKVVRVTRDKLP